MNKHFCLAVIVLLISFSASSADPEKTVTVYKSPTCGCCNGWVDYLRDNGFDVQTHDTDKLADLKAQLGLTDGKLMSCHTAVIDGYLVEGHVQHAPSRSLSLEGILVCRCLNQVQHI